ncbi:Asp23/Gls24 family envelope stress response protein [Streptacidiphilus sp. PB12-B1b]|uniref:Asp23/Gls24 family envelope stress response protein n=1 Tax=Streptacidiphilus sp. PB12-B1b TaxID=2705012 RepID=UPI0015FB8B4D|nr:Asp23/Gls24 family envelope stress response protein [Streptacidiphilus sp. PB12-B1b]QMU76987.1 Asp23/Gls24 family envelope stress response protein [Streptacidiphilus sp. PB12-B1b]
MTDDRKQYTAGNGAVGGKTTIADGVVATTAGLAAREVDGVADLGGGGSRAFGAVKDAVSRSSDPTRGVKVEVGERQAAIDLDVVVDYGVRIADTASALRGHVARAVTQTTGLEVVEVNVAVNEIRLPDTGDDDAEESRPERVQ